LFFFHKVNNQIRNHQETPRKKEYITCPSKTCEKSKRNLFNCPEDDRTHLNEVRKVIVFGSTDEARNSYAGERTASCNST